MRVSFAATFAIARNINTLEDGKFIAHGVFSPEVDPGKTLSHGTPHRDGTLLGETMEILGCRSIQFLFSQA
jgi:hypothetical protein